MSYKNTVDFQRAKFGMFIHWGLYAIPGGRWKGKCADYVGEWIQAKFRIPNAEYARLAEEFNPRDFDADAWVKCAKDAGMDYLVFTAKHHDGFAMYHSRISRYNIVDATPWGRDVLRELACACRRHGMKLGIYYSHCLDWHEPDGADPGPDSRKNFGMSWGNDWDFPDHAKKDFARYFTDKALPQLQELLTEYGPVFLLWLDCPLQITSAQAEELRSLVHKLQPDCLVSSRIGHGMGDFGSLGDNQSPVGQSRIALESANTINRTWGYKKDDHNWRCAREIIKDLLASNEKNVNYLLNIGPRADGKFPEASLDLLGEIAMWRKKQNVIIQGTGGNPFPQAFPWGYCTTADRTLQFFVIDERKEINISGLRNRIKSCNMPFRQEETMLHIYLPDEREDDLPVTVKVEIIGEPDIDPILTLQDGVLQLSPTQGEILIGNAAEKLNAEIELGPAAEALTNEPVCHLEPTGALTQWHHPGDGIAWNISIPEAGTYEFQVVTENRRHSAPWIGARTVRIEFGGQIMEMELRQDEMLSSSCYARSVSKIGALKLAGKEYGKLKIFNCKIDTPEAINMNLTAIRIYRQTGEK